MTGDATGQRLRTLPQEVRRRAAKHQEPGRKRLAVGQDAKHGEEVRAQLDLFQDDEPLKA